MRKLTICICENKDADRLCSNCIADQRLFYHYTEITIPLLIYEVSSFLSASVTVQASLCQTWSESQIVGFSHAAAQMMWIEPATFCDSLKRQAP